MTRHLSVSQQILLYKNVSTIGLLCGTNRTVKTIHFHKTSNSNKYLFFSCSFNFLTDYSFQRNHDELLKSCRVFIITCYSEK